MGAWLLRLRCFEKSRAGVGAGPVPAHPRPGAQPGPAGHLCPLQRFALEYERTPKAAQYYEELAKSLAQERLVRCVLYLIPSCHLLNYVSRHFARSAGRACFGLTRDWQTSPMDTPVTTPGSYARRPFLEFLRQQPL